MHSLLLMCLCLGIYSCNNEIILQNSIPLPPLSKNISQKNITNSITKEISENEKIADFIATLITKNTNIKNIDITPQRLTNSNNYNVRISFNVIEKNKDKTNKDLEKVSEIVGELINHYFIATNDYNYTYVNDAAQQFISKSFLYGKKEGYSLIPEKLKKNISKEEYITSIEQNHKDGYPDKVMMVGLKILPHTKEFYSFAFGKNPITPFIYLIKIHYEGNKQYGVVGFERISKSKFEKFANSMKFINPARSDLYFAEYDN